MTDKPFRFDWLPKEAYTDFMQLEGHEVGLLIQICNLMYLNNGPIENDPKWISQSIRNMGPAKARNIIKVLIEKEHLFVIDAGPDKGKIFKKMVEKQLNTVEKRRRKTKNNDEISEEFEGENEQNQDDNNSLEKSRRKQLPDISYSISKTLEELPDLSSDCLEAFFRFRADIGKPVHRNFIPSVIDDLKKLKSQGEDLNQVLLQSPKNGWSSLQPVKKEKQNGKRKSRKQDLGDQARELLAKYSDPKPHQSDDGIL